MTTRHPTLLVLSAALLTGLALLVTSCAPAATGRGPAVAVLNGPSDGSLPGSAELLQQEMAQQGALHFHFLNDAAMRFAEGHNDFHHDRAVTSAGRVARSYGAPYAVLIGAPTLDRKVTLSQSKAVRTVEVTVQMEAVVVGASNDGVVSRLSSQTFEQTRHESADTVLPPIQRDPTVLTLRDQAVGTIAPAVLGAVWSALGIRPSAPAR